MLSREQIEEARNLIGANDDWPSFAEGWTDEEHHAFFREVFALATKALDTERDAALGKAVREVLVGFGWDHKVVREQVESDYYAESVVGCVLVAIERQFRAEKDAAHLRAEGGE